MGEVVQFPAPKEEEEPPFEVMVSTMYSDGRVRTWLNDRVKSPGQFLWVHERISTIVETLSDLRGDGER